MNFTKFMPANLYHNQGEYSMTPQANKMKFKRLPKGQRTYLRRLKQVAEAEGTIYRSPIRRIPLKKAGDAPNVPVEG